MRALVLQVNGSVYRPASGKAVFSLSATVLSVIVNVMDWIARHSTDNKDLYLSWADGTRLTLDFADNVVQSSKATRVDNSCGAGSLQGWSQNELWQMLGYGQRWLGRLLWHPSFRGYCRSSNISSTGNCKFKVLIFAKLSKIRQSKN